LDEALIARIFQLFLALAGAYLLALWFALVVWTYRDITSRSTNAFTQIFSTLVVVLFFVPGAIIYLILRPRETLDEAFQRSMEEEYLLQDLDDYPLCPACRRAVRDDFVFCPHCSTELRHACTTCHRLVDIRWEVCPYCGTDQSV
jgi:RNA polymerase subunit RPABC4/transcription elongation factor Spt4